MGTAPFPFLLPLKVIKLHSVRTQVVMDPFSGSGTTCAAAALLGRQYIGFEKDEQLVERSKKRIGRAIEKAKAKAVEPLDPPKMIADTQFRGGTKLFVTDNTYISSPAGRQSLTPEEVAQLIDELARKSTDTNESTGTEHLAG